MFQKKGQTGEILNFLVIVIAVTVIIITMKSLTTDSKMIVTGTASSAHEEASFRSGVNAFMVMTESISGKTFLELLGYVGYLENTTIDFGGPKNPNIVDVEKEIVKRLDSIYGEGHWNLYVPIAKRSGIDIVIISDTSNSMCDDVAALKQGVVEMMSELKKEGKNTKIFIYFLTAFMNQCIFDDENGNEIIETIDCGYFENIDSDIHCVSPGLTRLCGDVSPRSDEDWGNGVACISEIGPSQNQDGSESGWRDLTIRIVIPLSDELTGGSECCMFRGDSCQEANCPTQRQTLDNGIEYAVRNNVKVFPMRADGCATECCWMQEFMGMEQRFCVDLSREYICPISEGLLRDWMIEMANATGGQMYDLKVETPVEALRNIAADQDLDRGPMILGSEIPEGKRIRSFKIAAPMPNYEYINLTLKQWS